MMNTKRLFAMWFLFCLQLAIANAQEILTIGGRITILDSVIVKEYNEEAIKLNIHLELSQQDSTILYHFNKFVNSSSEFPALKKWGKHPKNSGLIYIIEDDDGHCIDTWIRPGMVSCERVEDESRYYSSRWFVDTTSMKVFFGYIDDNALRKEFDLAKIVVTGGDAVLCVYPMMLNSSIYTKDELKPGRYKIYLYYSMQEDGLFRFFDEMWPLSTPVFMGTLFSNKVDLIVKNRPVRWWEFWKRRP